MRAVLDVNVLISALISRASAPAQLVLRWLDGEFELIASEKLMAELTRSLGYSKLRSRVGTGEAAAVVELLRTTAAFALDPSRPQRRSRDLGDDFLVALAESASASLVSGDRDLLALAPNLPVLTAADFLAQLGTVE